MKAYLNLFLKTNLLFGIIVCLSSCKKEDNLGTNAVASLLIVNTLPTSIPLIPVVGTAAPVRFNSVTGTDKYGTYQALGKIGTISYSSNVPFTAVAGDQAVYLVQNNADSLSNGQGGLAKYMFQKNLQLSGNSSYSLFITGKDTTAADYLFVQDMLPYHNVTDSTAGIRFVNLSANSNPISINIKGSVNGSEASSLAYKAITDFKNYSAKSTISSYIFEIRDASSGTLIASYTLSGVNGGSTTASNTVRFKNFTLALIGQPGANGTYAQKCILINNY